MDLVSASTLRNLFYLTHRFIQDGGDNASMRVPGGPVITLRQSEMADGFAAQLRPGKTSDACHPGVLPQAKHWFFAALSFPAIS